MTGMMEMERKDLEREGAPFEHHTLYMVISPPFCCQCVPRGPERGTSFKPSVDGAGKCCS